MEVRIKYLSDLLGNKVKAPFYATEDAAGMDVSACINEDIIIKPGERVKVPCGFAIEIPKGYAGFLYARSGLSTKFGINLPNSVGVIDSDYRGEVICALTNNLAEEFVLKAGERIAQLVITPVLRCTLVKSDELDSTDRGDGGFGSTGRK